jgi:hypothetical protein
MKAQEIYLSYWVYIDRLAGEQSRNIKLGYLSTTTPNDDWLHGTPQFQVNRFYHSSQGRGEGMYIQNSAYPFEDGNVVYFPDGYLFEEGMWQRIELYLKLGSPDIANGKRGFWYNKLRVSHPKIDDNACMTLESTSTKPFIENVLLGNYVAHDPGGDYALYYDDVYVDTTQARVELCDTPTWPDGKIVAHCEIQVPISWTDGSITFKPNLGTLSDKSELYVYVIDGSGDANVAGHPLCIDCGRHPRAPTGLRFRY